jgi:hypothetical protein
MKFLESVSEATGKTVKSVYESGYQDKIILVFTDETVLVLEPSSGWDDDMSIAVRDYMNDSDRHEAGFLTDEEYDAILKSEQAKRDKLFKERELAELKRLQEKYAAGGTKNV